MNDILTNIKYGWCNFRLDGYEARPSYVRFLPLDIIDAWKEYQESHHCIIEFDEELTQFCIVIWENNIVILDNRNNKINITVINYNAEDVLNELIKEIVDNLDVWAEWISTTGTDENIQRCKELIIKRMNEVDLPNPYYKTKLQIM